ncbi:acyl-coenzyme A thioesterase 9, mitochondrial isoform X1 [Canis lupus baileyi]|uniref:acyl-coenzyme A thioesterase 9, mitochondrial isoform X1 n=1 Tax=Canis lupus dingo TaxID=286419 RepID=UPI0002749855|nr:acyl-coenzyme A thioesterase 9, mitochondrial isoform X1 [Canis lupus dingo]XP_038305580.1 acyl-coenzyme A thioesterase 9, mitochondrial isoform X2 [Canis lupus familiaris]XP_038443006.1 acyl-coenzyme A thioesterase 9, mitochondrial isoform X2 [Canis lupus familiaris]|eukprot:XP_022271355.1 acyl-coenzyme A thioesterase 9, mitochondrial isoform X2 [Canis lupus familiaris]
MKEKDTRWTHELHKRMVNMLCTLNKELLIPGRGLTQGFQNPEKQRVFHMHEACSPIHVNHVRDKLREIVGVSTNWRDHMKAMEERKLLQSFLAKSQEGLPPRRMKDSYIEVLLPLGSQPELREKYLTVQNTIRFGRILEDLDSLGVLICYMHTRVHAAKMSPLSIVTALVDKIDMCKTSLSPEQDIKFSGHVSWVGKTSMEVKMQMFQLHGNEFCPVLDATFVMVARDSENKGPAFVNPLIPESPEEEELFRQGELNKGRRVTFSATSLLKMAPSAEERTTIHEMFLNTLDPKTVSFRSRVLPPNAVWMENSKLKSLEVCHPQERNIFNRIFGGFLMRKAYELGWATACNFGGSRPFVVAVDDIMFQKPVEVGSLLFLSSQVCFTKDNYIQVRVHSEVASLESKEHMTTNVFHFTFMSEKEVPLVFPRTYGESMLYLDGKRHFNSMSVPVKLRKDFSEAP